MIWERAAIAVETATPWIMAGLIIADTGATMAENLLNNSEDIVDGSFPKSAARGQQLERIADVNLGGNVNLIDDLADDGTGTSFRSHSLAGGEKAYLQAIRQDAQQVSRAPNEAIYGTDRYGNYRNFAVGRVKQAALVVAIPQNESRILLSPTFRAALQSYRNTYNTTIRVVPVQRWIRK